MTMSLSQKSGFRREGMYPHVTTCNDHQNEHDIYMVIYPPADTIEVDITGYPAMTVADTTAVAIPDSLVIPDVIPVIPVIRDSSLVKIDTISIKKL